MNRPHCDLTGQKFGRLTAIRFLSHGFWECQCECGRLTRVVSTALRKARCRSCGCLKIDELVERRHRNPIHGHAAYGRRSPTYISWEQMMARCHTPGSTSYRWYGAVGIAVCDAWWVFARFLRDMGERPAGTSLDRIDGTLGYFPGNCRWSTGREQNLNRRDRTLKLFDIDGHRLTLREVAHQLAMPRSTYTLKLRERHTW